MKTLFILICLITTQAAHANSIAVSIAPVRALIEMILPDHQKSILIIPENASPHFSSLKPSQIKTLYDSKIIFWLGPDNEPMLANVISRLNPDVRVINLLQADGLKLRHFSSDHGHSKASLIDPHVWLDIDNAKAIINIAATTLSEYFPDNRIHYQGRAAHAIEQLQQLDQAIDSQLEGVTSKPFMVTHDAYQYFVTRYDLNQIGVIKSQHGHSPGMRQMEYLTELAQQTKVKCLITESNNDQRLARRLANMISANITAVDPVRLPAGKPDYIKFMQSVATRFESCLLSP